MEDISQQSGLSWLHRTGGRVYSTVDPDEAQQAIESTYHRSTLVVKKGPADFAFKLRVAELPGINLGRIRFGSDVSVTAPPPSIYVVCFAPRGALEIRSGRSSQIVTSLRGAVIDPEQISYFENWSPDAELVSLRVDRALLDRMLTQLTGKAPSTGIRFQLDLDPTRTRSSSLIRALQMLQAESRDPAGLAAEPKTASVLSELVATSLLVSQPHNYSDAITDRGKPAPPTAISVVTELIDSDPMAVNTVGDLAARAHVSVRSLEDGFQRYLDIAPMAYLRNVRLARVRADLLITSPREHTVASIARRWGFRHLGRFANVYRQQFGELPGETLWKNVRSGRV